MIELLQQALDALETCTPGDYSTGHVIHPWHDDALIDAAIDALRAHLAQPQGLTDAEISKLWDDHTIPVFGKTGINPIVFARAVLAAAQPSPVPVPPGWKLVPVEPTPEMLRAAYDTAIRHFAGDWTNDECATEQERADKSNADYYRAMIAASPEQKP